MVKIWDTETGELAEKILEIHDNTITSIGFSPSGDRIITCGMDKMCKVYDLKSKNVTVKLVGHEAVVPSYSISNNEKFVATVSWDKTLRVWDITTGAYRNNGALLFENGHEGCVSCCKFSPDNAIIVTAGYDKRVVIWDTNRPTPKLIMKVIGCIFLL